MRRRTASSASTSPGRLPISTRASSTCIRFCWPSQITAAAACRWLGPTGIVEQKENECCQEWSCLHERTAMPAVVKIKPGKYGNTIGLLLERGGTFQTRHERTLIVNSDQKKLLREAGFVEITPSRLPTGSLRA